MTIDDIDDDPGYESEDDFLDDTERRDDEEAQWTCQLGKDCLVASPFHHRDECFNVEMAREMFGDTPPDEEPPDDVSLS